MRRALLFRAAVTPRRAVRDQVAQAFLRPWVQRCTFPNMDSGRETRSGPAHPSAPVLKHMNRLRLARRAPGLSGGSPMSRVLVLSLVLLVVSACADNILKERPVNAARTQEPATSLSTHPKSQSHSSVCAAYRRQLQQVKVAQSLKVLSSRKAELRDKALSLNAVIADACE